MVHPGLFSMQGLRLGWQQELWMAQLVCLVFKDKNTFGNILFAFATGCLESLQTHILNTYVLASLHHINEVSTRPCVNLFKK